MSKFPLFEKLEFDEPREENACSEKLQLVVYDDWKNIFIRGVFMTVLLCSAVLLTYFLARQPVCQPGIATSSNLHSRPGLTHVSTEKSSRKTSTLTPPGHIVKAAAHYSCVSGFTYINHKCWKLITGSKRRADADQVCFHRDGSTLFTIRNDQENRAVLDFVKGKKVENLWTGLICDGHDPSWCTWDVKSGNTADYNNFAKDYPDNKYGDCIYYMTSGTQAGKWASGSCDESMSFVCELPPTIYDETCRYNYNNYCYTPYYEQHNLKLSSEAQSYCASLGSNLASIHSANENRFARSLFSPFATVAIGGIANSDDFILWYDGTTTTFINVIEFKRGSCLFLGNDFGGHWIGYDCLYDKALLLCKRKVSEA